ncbi:tandem-95 repeat protein [Taibaiella lutea]|uniref:Tandem-95 repeat protein n=1 Tax=Taibaiella lutea TaxID=2608001 RepID=A0A5M6CFF4_9BACT|nr:Ig-like domain-containing protein [Taibaiella lutea]KAA5533170.1 tandem-95 repeat protein [Taibaiella lutea]
MKNSKIYLGVIGWVCLLILGMSSVKAQTFNLNTIEPDIIPAGSILEWHSAVPVSTGNLITNDTAVNPGIYYAVYKKGTCYSAPSPFKIVKTDCGSNFTNLYKSVDTTDKPAGTILTFHTIKPVDVSNLYSGNAHVAPVGTYYAAFYDPVKGCFTLASPIRVIPNIACSTNPDFNVTHINVPVNGNVHTNDNVPAGTTYGTPVAGGSNPNTSVPVMNPDGTYTFTPTQTGVYTFYVPVCSADTTIGCVNETLTITVTNPYGSNPPIVNPDISVVDSGSIVTIPVLDNDQPGNPGGHFGPPVPSDPPNGTVTTTPGGDIVYTPDPGFTGVDSFTYTVCDTTANPDLCRSSTVTVNVNPGPSPNIILASDDFVKISMNTMAAGNVTSNDMDPNGDPMKVTAQNIYTASVGTFVLDTSGNYSFTPDEDFFGSVNFPYTVCDTAGHCATATLYILVDPVNTLNPDFNITHLNTPVNGDVSTNDNSVSGTLYGTPIAGTGNSSTDVPQMQTNGTYTFTPTNTGVYVFNVPVCPPGMTIDCPTETLTITVTNPYTPGGSNPPVVNPDISVVDSGSTVTIPVLDNDQPGNPGGSFGPPTVTDPPHGTVTTTPGGEIIYTPDPGFTGVDTFTYTVCDTTVVPSLCGTTTVTVNVNTPGAANTILANDDYVNIKMNTTANGNVMSNDIDPDGDPIMVTTQNTTTAAGTFVVDATGNYTFTPAAGTHGPVQIPYTVCDTAGNCTTATLHVLIDPVNTLEPDFNVTNINTPVSGNLSTNDELVSGSTFGTPVANTGNPTADLPTLNSNGSYSFTPDTAGVYTFYVPVCAPGQPAPCPTETLTITVLNPFTPVFPPVVNPDNATGRSDSTITINITGNDDPTSPGGSFGTPGITTPPSNGTVVVNTNGTVDYTPTPGFTGVDSFTYTICDTVPTPDQCGSATVTVNVLPPNAINSVAANDDYANTYGTVPATGNVLLNDNDPEGGTLTVTSQNVTTPQGTLTLSDNGQYTFTPAAGFTGTTSFTYTVCDNGTPQACDQATLHILVDKAPDYTPLVFGSSTLFSNNDTIRNFIVAIYNVNNTINKGPVKFRMSQSLPNKEFIIDPAMASINYNGNAIAVSNADWNIVLNGSFYEFTLKPNAIITPNGSKYIGFTVKVPDTAPYNQVQPVTANIIYQSGGDNNYSNNNYSITITRN